MTDGLDCLLDLRRRLYRMLDAGAAAAARPGDSFTPPLDIVSGPDGLTITVELPGMAREDINVELQGNLLTISGERKTRCGHEWEGLSSPDPHVTRPVVGAGKPLPLSGMRTHRRERPAGRFSRSLALPTSDEHELSAALKDGVLIVQVRGVIPKG